MLNQLLEFAAGAFLLVFGYYRLFLLKKHGILLSSICLLFLLFGCNADNYHPPSNGFPEPISTIVRQQCSVSGCHTTKSAEAAGGLNLETWDALFEGSRGGSPIVPYSPKQSFLMYAINQYSTPYPILEPTMPIGLPPLSLVRFREIEQWVLEGARNDRGEERFPIQSHRRKWYVGSRGCDFVSVFDAESKQVMRYIPVGANPNRVEGPYSIEISPDGQYWYIIFSTFDAHIEKRSTLTDELIAEIPLGYTGWNTMVITDDSKYGFICGENIRDIAVLDLEKNALHGTPIQLPASIRNPAIHPNFNKVYLPMSQRSDMLVLDFDNAGTLSNLQTIDMTQGVPSSFPGNLWPADILFLPDGSKYFVVCQASNEIRIMDGNTDLLLDVIQVGQRPSELAISIPNGHLFVSCSEDSSSFAGEPEKRGSVMVIDIQSHQIIKTIYTGYQPHGLSVDEKEGFLVVANRNLEVFSSSQHHPSPCGGVNGYVTLINLQTLELEPEFKTELLADPFPVAIKN